MTHKSPAMTQRYAHLRDDALQQASNIASDIISEIADSTGDKKVINMDEHKK